MGLFIRLKTKKFVFAPGCALMLYKPDLAKKVHLMLNELFGEMDLHLTCCQHEPNLEPGTVVINICPGCNKRFANDYPHISTISLWEILAEVDSFPFPDYRGLSMSIIDACPTREQEKIHDAIRILLKKMNINVVEPKNTRSKSTCCGDSFYGLIPVEEVKELMVKRTSEMTENEVVVYCISCVKAVYNGGKNSRYLVDLLFNEETLPRTLDLDKWHEELNSFIEAH
jgi:Fe-S oxidoreductase